MAGHREKVHLTAEQETLLITLYSRAVSHPRSVFFDEKSQEILERVDYDFSRLKVPVGTRLTVCLRARKLDDDAREFLASHPRGMVLHLGCGLDSRCTRVDNGEVTWYDLDLPDVIALRRKFFMEGPRYHMIPSSVTDLSWMDAVPRGNGNVLIIAEGLTMYLEELAVKALILKLKENLPGSELAFDAYSTLTARSVRRHPSVRATGATMHWGIDDARAIESWAKGIRLREEWTFTQSEHIGKLALGYRLMFRLTGLFSVARKAHRILYFLL
jgi:O-methyltransferase involved in polyketide biosynthesis